MPLVAAGSVKANLFTNLARKYKHVYLQLHHILDHHKGFLKLLEGQVRIIRHLSCSFLPRCDTH